MTAYTIHFDKMTMGRLTNREVTVVKNIVLQMPDHTTIYNIAFAHSDFPSDFAFSLPEISPMLKIFTSENFLNLANKKIVYLVYNQSRLLEISEEEWNQLTT